MGRTVKKLSGLEIDEVSLVDRPANQHGLVAIAKNHQEDDMGEIFDAQGNPVEEEELEHGDVVYDGNGEELVFVEQEVQADDGGYEDEEFGKAAPAWLGRAGAKAREYGSSFVDNAEYYGDQAGRKAKQAGRLPRQLKSSFQSGQRSGAAGKEVNLGTRRSGVRAAGYDAGRVYGKHPRAVKYGAAGVGGAGALGGGAVAYDRYSKSLGEEVYGELSKALTDEDRNEVISKAMDLIEDVAKRNEQLEEALYSLIEDREAEGYFELAKNYDLPIDPEGLGGLMHRAAQVMDPHDLQTMDRLFSSVGEIAKSGGFEQIGYDGYAESDVLAQAYAIAGEAISKSDGAVSQEQALTALFSANPAAYDAYEAEKFQR